VNIFLTLDYEIFFGSPTGEARNCIIDPTNRLMEITERTGVPMTYFIDIGYLIQLEKYKTEFSKLTIDFELVKNQIQRLVDQGNDCQLHIHPHWEDSFFDGYGWNIDVTRYKLRDFESGYASELIKRYKTRLERVTGKKVTSFRAGGWCLQPFNGVKRTFEELNIRVDSTVFEGGFADNEIYYYDFRDVPNKTRWRFDENLTVENNNGPFLELPISAFRYNPLFFWRLFILGRLKPQIHKPLGDGKPVASGDNGKKQLLSKWNVLPVCLDGYFAKKMDAALIKQEKKKVGEDFVVIGHPKACTNYSLEKLEEFIVKHKDQHNFMTFAEVEA